LSENSVDIVIRGRDEASAEIRRVYSEMKQLGEISDESRARLAGASETIREQSQVLRLVSTSTRVQYSDAILMANALSRVGAMASHVTSMINAYNIAAIRVTEAQRDYREALTQFGPASKQAQEALDRLKAAQQAQQATMISLMAQIPGLIAQFISLTISMQAAGIAARGFWAAMGPAGWAILGISAVAGGAAIWAATRPPSAQTGPGQIAEISRTGLAIVHRGETVSRGGAGLNVSGPLVAIGKIEMRPEGDSPFETAGALGRLIQHRLRALTVATPL